MASSQVISSTFPALQTSPNSTKVQLMNYPSSYSTTVEHFSVAAPSLGIVNKTFRKIQTVLKQSLKILSLLAIFNGINIV